LIDFGGPAKDCPGLIETSEDCGVTCLGCHTEFLLDLIDGNLELAILSHNHWDHYGGFADFLGVLEDAGKVLERLWQGLDRDADTEGPNWGEFENAVKSAGLSEATGDSAGIRLELHPDLTWTFFSPRDLNQAKKNDNRNSVVLLLTYGDGDIQSPSEESFVTRDEALPGTLVLKVPHHGSSSSSSMTDEFLDWADPELAIVSGDADDLKPETVAALGRHMVPFLQTSENGTIRISTDGVSVWIVAGIRK